MKILPILIQAVILVVSIITISNVLYIWQLKEYRLDRLMAHKSIFKKLFALRFPKLTLKSIILVTTKLLLLFFLFFSLKLSPLVILLPLFAFFIASLTIVSFKPIELFPKKAIILLAKRKLQSLPNLKVIGITGSYAKTSVKEFTATILSSKLKVAKTPKNTNTLLGIALFVLRKLPKNTQIFVAEIGAYKRGEIKKITNFVKPQIGVITGITPQHLALFGSFENLLQAKKELLDSLPPGGIAIINGNDRNALLLAKDFLGKKIVYSTEKGDLVAKNIKAKINSLEFTLKINSKKVLMKAGLLGRHNVLNLLAALSMAKALGFSFAEMKKGIVKIKPLDHTLKPFSGIRNTLVLDDSYSQNPKGVKAAFELVRIFGGRKILIMPCLIELGKESQNFHQELGGEIANIFHLAIITTAENFSDIILGTKDKSKKVKLIESPKKVVKLLKSELKEKDLILIEGRVSAKIIEFLT